MVNSDQSINIWENPWVPNMLEFKAIRADFINIWNASPHDSEIVYQLVDQEIRM